MLVYHPAYDSYHCITRILKILNILNKREFNIDRIRIYDYYFLFINDIHKISLPREFFKYKELVQNNKYNAVDNPRYVFNQLENVQNIAFKAMASFGFIDKELLDNDTIKLISFELPKGLTSECSKQEIEYISFVNEYFEKISLRELKSRTNLMEYRYELS